MIQEPRNLVVSRVATLNSGAVVHAVIGEGSPAHGVAPGAYVRWHDGRAWSDWRLIETGARDVDVAAVPGRPEPAALVSVVSWTAAGAGALTGKSVTWTPRFFWLTASGVEEAANL